MNISPRRFQTSNSLINSTRLLSCFRRLRQQGFVRSNIKWLNRRLRENQMTTVSHLKKLSPQFGCTHSLSGTHSPSGLQASTAMPRFLVWISPRYTGTVGFWPMKHDTMSVPPGQRDDRKTDTGGGIYLVDGPNEKPHLKLPRGH